MNRHLWKALAALGLFASTQLGAQTRCETCEWADRGDRWEGEVLAEQIAGGSFELLSVHLRQASEPVETSEAAGQLHLSFWLPEPTELDEIRVWQPRGNLPDYRMTPHRKQYDADRQDFAWPHGPVIDALGLSIRSLYTLVGTEQAYFPALLSTSVASTPVQYYAFVFMSGAAFEAQCSIERRDEDVEVLSRFECFEDYGGTTVIEWDGRDDQSRGVPRGFYFLEIRGEMLGETTESLRRSVTFWHPGSFDQKEE